jgi:hypothetical protein
MLKTWEILWNLKLVHNIAVNFMQKKRKLAIKAINSIGSVVLIALDAQKAFIILDFGMCISFANPSMECHFLFGRLCLLNFYNARSYHCCYLVLQSFFFD